MERAAEELEPVVAVLMKLLPEICPPAEAATRVEGEAIIRVVVIGLKMLLALVVI